MMESHNVECDLQSLRRLYRLLQSNSSNESIPQAFLLDENTQSLLKRLLDSATKELLATQFNILVQVEQLRLPEKVSTPRKNSVSRGIISNKSGLTEEIVDSIKRIETQLSAFNFRSSRVLDSDDRNRSCYKSPTSPTEENYLSSTMPLDRYEVPKLSEKALMEHREKFRQDSMSRLRNNYMPISQTPSTSKISPSLRSAINRRGDDRISIPKSQGRCSRDVRVKSRSPLPHLHATSVGVKNPSASKKESQKMMSMKPTLLDQGSETWDDEESVNTWSSTTNSEDEELVLPSLRSAINQRGDDRISIPKSQGRCSRDVRVKSRSPLPSLHARSVGVKKPSASKKESQKMMSMKPTLLDQGSENWDDEESVNTWSRTTNSEDEELVSPSLRSAINQRGDDRILIPKSQGRCSRDVQVKSRSPLPPLHARSVGVKKPSASKKASQKMMSMKLTLLDQGSETWDDEESVNTRSRTTNSEDEELVSIEQESEERSKEIKSSTASSSSWETQGESVTKSNSSSPLESNNDGDEESQVSESPPYKKRDNKASNFAKQRKKTIGRFTRFKNKIGRVFHHHHHHHHSPPQQQGERP